MPYIDIFAGLYTTRLMTGPEAVEIIRELGISQAQFARLAQLNKNSVTKWVNGSQPHGPAVVLLMLLRERPELLKLLERWEEK